KTGTTQDYHDAWFVGYTSHLTAGVWLGNDDSSPTKHTSGSNFPVEIWSRFMKEALKGGPAQPLPFDTSRPVPATPTPPTAPEPLGETQQQAPEPVEWAPAPPIPPAPAPPAAVMAPHRAAPLTSSGEHDLIPPEPIPNVE